MKSKMQRVVITLPAYHAETTLEKTVADLPPGLADELILVDDASADNTAQLARDLGISVYVHPENRGYGGNQKTCYSKALESGADIVVLLHPDYQYDPKAVPLLIAPILAGDADMTFGSRFAGLGDPRGGGMPRYRYWGNRFTTMVENLALGTRFSEMHSGLRAYTRRCLLSLPFTEYSDDFTFDSQFLVDAVVTGKRVVEVPIPTRYTKESSSISVLRSLRYVFNSMRYAWGQSTRWGRRGKRSPVAMRRGSIRSVPIDRGDGWCALCGSDDREILYPSNATGPALPAEFACTSDALATHDDIARCRSCGMVSSLPAADESEIVDNYSEMTDETYLAEQHARTELFEWVLERMESFWLPGRRLVEIGSNVGLFLHVAGKKGWTAVGIEPSRWAVRVGRERFGVDVRPGTVRDLSVPAGSAHAVVMLDVLEHLYDPLGDLKKLRTAINEDGLLTLSTINLAGLHARVRDGSWPWFIRPHLHYFTPDTLNAMLRAAGFEMVEWNLVPRTFHLSYVAERAAGSHGALARAALAASKVADPRLPLGWLGDVVMVQARPLDH